MAFGAPGIGVVAAYLVATISFAVIAIQVAFLPVRVVAALLTLLGLFMLFASRSSWPHFGPRPGERVDRP